MINIFLHTPEDINDNYIKNPCIDLCKQNKQMQLIEIHKIMVSEDSYNVITNQVDVVALLMYLVRTKQITFDKFNITRGKYLVGISDDGQILCTQSDESKLKFRLVFSNGQQDWISSL